MSLEELGVPSVAIISDQFEGLAVATLRGLKGGLPVDIPDVLSIVPYPISGLEREAVEAKATAVAPVVAERLARRLMG